MNLKGAKRHSKKNLEGVRDHSSNLYYAVIACLISFLTQCSQREVGRLVSRTSRGVGKANPGRTGQSRQVCTLSGPILMRGMQGMISEP